MESGRQLDPERRFEEQHEEQARQGWPGVWATVAAFDEVWETWPKEKRDALLATGNEAYQRYLVATADRYHDYRRQAKASSDAAATEAWRRFLKATARDRKTFRSAIFAKFLSLRDE